MDGKKLLWQYLKIFIILVIVGFLLPYIMEKLINMIYFINERNHSGNSIFVFNHRGFERTYFDYVISLLEKLIDFS